MSGGRYTQSDSEEGSTDTVRMPIGVVHISATWQIRLNRPCAAAMRPYVKLLWPLVNEFTAESQGQRILQTSEHLATSYYYEHPRWVQECVSDGSRRWMERRPELEAV